MFGRKGSAEDQILPIGVMIAAELGNPVSCRSAGRERLPIELPQLCRGHHRNFRGDVLQAGRAIIADLWAASFTFLGGDENNAVRSAGAVNCSRRCVFQDSE